MTRDELLDRLHDAVSQMEDEHLEMFVTAAEVLVMADAQCQRRSTPNNALSARLFQFPDSQNQEGK